MHHRREDRPEVAGIEPAGVLQPGLSGNEPQQPLDSIGVVLVGGRMEERVRDWRGAPCRRGGADLGARARERCDERCPRCHGRVAAAGPSRYPLAGPGHRLGGLNRGCGISGVSTTEGRKTEGILALRLVSSA
jgi:hypothetical protein